MRVIRKGVKKAWVTTATCTGKLFKDVVYREGCGALLEVLESDLFNQSIEVGPRDFTNDHQDGPDSDPTMFKPAFECSECGTVTVVEKIPLMIVQRNRPLRSWPPPKKTLLSLRRRSRFARI